MAASTLRSRAQELQARTTAEVDKGSSSCGQTSGVARGQASWFRPLHLLLVFACLSPVTFSIPKVEAGTSPVDSLLQDLTAVLERAQRLEQSGVPAFQQIQRHLDAFISQVEEAQKSLWEAVATDDARGLEAAVRRGAVIERRRPDKMSPLAHAAKEGRVDAVWALLRLGAEANATAGERKLSPLRWARLYKNKKCETLLLAVGAHEGKVTRAEAQRQLWEGVNEDDGVKIEGAVHSGADLEEVRDSDEMTPLTEAAYLGRVEAVRALLRLGVRVEGTGSRAQGTALYWASYWGHAAVVRELLAAGASLEAEDSYRYTPLHVASGNGHEAVVRQLLAAGASLRAEAGDRWTPLYSASFSGRVAVVRELLAAGASLQAETDHGYTPLHGASGRGHLTIARLLVEAGADLNPRNRYGKTPLALAVGEGHPDVAEYLRSVGATM